jgi:hypothetical protein
MTIDEARQMAIDLQSCRSCSWGTQNNREKGLEDIVSTQSTPALLTPPTKRSIRADHLL